MEERHYTKLYELLSSAKQEAESEQIFEMAHNIELLLELIRYRTKCKDCR